MRDQENILLASGSQRRRELLSWVTDRFEIIPSDIDESPLPGERPEVYCQRIAEQKALAIPSRTETQNSFVLAADTIVYSQNRIIGKPKDEQDAFQILTFLQAVYEILFERADVYGQRRPYFHLRAEKSRYPDIQIIRQKP